MIANGVINSAEDDDIPTRVSCWRTWRRITAFRVTLLCNRWPDEALGGGHRGENGVIVHATQGVRSSTRIHAERLRASSVEQFQKHPLRREIIATTTVNYARSPSGRHVPVAHDAERRRRTRSADAARVSWTRSREIGRGRAAGRDTAAGINPRKNSGAARHRRRA